MAHPIEDFPKLLENFGVLINSAKKVPVTPENAWKNHGQIMLIKVYSHLESISILIGEIEAQNDSKAHRYVDHGSIAVLARAAYETYVLFYFIFCAKSPEERQFRHQVWRLSGLISRSKLNRPVNLPIELKKQIKREADEIVRLCDVVKSDPVFDRLDKKTRDNVLKGEGVRLGRPLIDLAESAGLPRKYTADMYNSFCNYAHAGAVSAYQIHEALNEGTSSIFARATMGFCCILLSQMMLGYTELFDEVDLSVALNDELCHLIALWQGLKNQFEVMYSSDLANRP